MLPAYLSRGELLQELLLGVCLAENKVVSNLDVRATICSSYQDFVGTEVIRVSIESLEK